MKLIDTTVAVDHLRGDERATTLLRWLIEDDELAVASDLTRFELLAGMRSEVRDQTEQFFSVLTWVPVNEAIAREAGALAARYRRSHGSVGAVDYLLAATASVIGADLVTTDVRRFPMIPGLEQPY
jgi:predicted nucleic acid-binding protein